MQLLGLDGIEYLTTTDSFKRGLLGAIAEAAVKYRDTEQHNLATKIAEEVSKIFK